MERAGQLELDGLVALIREVKPSLADTEISRQDFLMETLGRHFLDVTQLARLVRRRFCRDFDQDAWLEGAKEHQLSVNSLLGAMTDAMAG